MSEEMWLYQLQYSKIWSFQLFKGASDTKNKNVGKEYSHLIHSVDLIAGIDFIQ